MRTRILLFPLALVSACAALDDDAPAMWVESTVADVYFVGTLPAGAATASVLFATAPLDRLQLPLDFAIHVAAFHDVGDNYYTDTLDYLDLRDPVYEGDEWWRWAGSLVLPPFLGGPGAGRVTLGIQIRAMPYEAVRTMPLAHRHCTIDLLGAGVIDCEPWADALFHGKIRCRGLVGQLIPCHGIGYEIVPQVLMTGIAQRQGAAMDGEWFTYWILAGVTFTRHADGWRYSAHGVPEQGPFGEPEDAARDAADRLPWPQATPDMAVGVVGIMPDADFVRLGRALHRETSRAARAPRHTE